MTSNFPTTSIGRTSISTVHQDIIKTHILTKLDGPTLASTACSSPTLHAHCTEQNLWRDICNSTWPSIDDPRIRHVISSFPAGYRSFFSDSFPANFHNTKRFNHSPSAPPTSELISAVDIRYDGKTICSKVEVTETVTNAFLAPPFWIDLIDRKQIVQTPVKFEKDEDFLKHLEESMTLSWIIIDPNRTRSANFSSVKPVSVRRQSAAADEVEVLYATVLPGFGRVGSSGDPVQCRVSVTCGGEEGGEMHVREVNMQVQDMEGINLSGEDSLVILQEAMERERRKIVKGRERHEEYLKMMRERREMREMRERGFDFIFYTIIGVVVFIGLVCGLLG